MNNNETKELPKEILKWQKVIGSEYLKRKVRDERLFTEEKHIVAYDLSDGTKSSRDIGRIAGLSHVAIQNLWKQWIEAGIAEPSQKYKGGQCKRLFELNDFGVQLPKDKK